MMPYFAWSSDWSALSKALKELSMIVESKLDNNEELSLFLTLTKNIVWKHRSPFSYNLLRVFYLLKNPEVGFVFLWHIIQGTVYSYKKGNRMKNPQTMNQDVDMAQQVLNQSIDIAEGF